MPLDPTGSPPTPTDPPPPSPPPSHGSWNPMVGPPVEEETPDLTPAGYYDARKPAQQQEGYETAYPPRVWSSAQAGIPNPATDLPSDVDLARIEAVRALRTSDWTAEGQLWIIAGATGIVGLLGLIGGPMAVAAIAIAVLAAAGAAYANTADSRLMVTAGVAVAGLGLSIYTCADYHVWPYPVLLVTPLAYLVHKVGQHARQSSFDSDSGSAEAIAIGMGVIFYMGLGWLILTSAPEGAMTAGVIFGTPALLGTQSLYTQLRHYVAGTRAARAVAGEEGLAADPESVEGRLLILAHQRDQGRISPEEYEDAARRLVAQAEAPPTQR